LSAQIQRGVNLHIPGDSILSTPASKAELATSGAVRYSAAVGLALRANRAATEVAPPVDLFASERLTIKADGEKRMVALGLAFGAAALVLGIIGMIAIEGAIGTKSKMVAVLEGQATTIKQSTSQSLKSRAGDVEQYRLLRSEGSPVVPLMDYLTSAMPPQTSLTAITVDAARQARISGESVSEDGVMALLRPLQSVPVITEPRLDSMKVDPEKGGYTFTITGQLVGMDQVRLPRPVGGTP
jgi:Tfp pilus assembly protein PilN